MAEEMKIDFYKKRCRCENVSRIKFFLKNKERIYKNANAENLFTSRLEKLQKETDEVNQKIRNDLLAKIKLPEIKEIVDLKEYAKNIGKVFPELGDGRCLTKDMKEIPHQQLNLLYSGGKEFYLKDRYKLKPEEKFYFPNTTSWQYGWKMNGLPKANTDDKHYGREFALKHFVYRKNGLAMFQFETQSPHTLISTSL